MKPAHDFQGRWSVAWCTSYTLEPTIFESFLLPRLGEPPLNVVVLVDFGRLARTWDGVDPTEQWRVRRANRDYLVRGVSVSHGAFHPKTYFFANSKEAVLLVGSGNLSLSGLEMGHELFSRFSSDDPGGVAAVREWLAWMGQIVAATGDPMLNSRWLDLRTRLGWLPNSETLSSAFVINWDRPLIRAFTEGLPSPIDELHVMAPFYDADIRALARVLADTSPGQVHLYLSPETKVSGHRLRVVLDAQPAVVHLHGFRPPEFVHAKLFAAINGAHGRVLGGSANASGPALLAAFASGGHVNVEAGTISDVPADVARALFIPNGMELRPLTLDELSDLEFKLEPEEPLHQVRLSSAHLDAGGHLIVTIDPPEVMDATLLVTDGRTTASIIGGRTVEPFSADPDLVFVWLIDAKGSQVSNRVPLDDRVQLDRRLQQRTATSETPAGLDFRDLSHPAGEMLARLHRECIFDFNETSAAQRIKRLPEEIEDPDFWDSFAKEELHQDPRVSRYAGLRSADGLQDDIFLLLEQLLHEAPRRGFLRVLGGGEVVESVDNDEEPRRWSTDRRFQVRLFNLLERWSQALGDPRLFWIDPLAPVRNYAAILTALVECWVQGFVQPHRVVVLVEALLGAFVRTERATGYLLTLDDDERQGALRLLQGSGAPPVAAALAYAALRPRDDVLDRVFRLQPMLVTALELGVVQPAAGSDDLVTALVGDTPTVSDISERLTWAASHIDDEHWCDKIERDYELSGVTLARDHPHFGLTIAIDGLSEPLTDSRIVSVARQAVDYAKTDSVILAVADGKVSIRIDGDAFARVHGIEYESVEPVTHELLEQLEATGAGVGAILRATAEQAS